MESKIEKPKISENKLEKLKGKYFHLLIDAWQDFKDSDLPKVPINYYNSKQKKIGTLVVIDRRLSVYRNILIKIIIGAQCLLTLELLFDIETMNFKDENKKDINLEEAEMAKIVDNIVNSLKRGMSDSISKKTRKNIKKIL